MSQLNEVLAKEPEQDSKSKDIFFLLLLFTLAY
jgi:hypothetical protein